MREFSTDELDMLLRILTLGVLASGTPQEASPTRTGSTLKMTGWSPQINFANVCSVTLNRTAGTLKSTCNIDSGTSHREENLDLKAQLDELKVQVESNQQSTVNNFGLVQLDVIALQTQTAEIAELKTRLEQAEAQIEQLISGALAAPSPAPACAEIRDPLFSSCERILQFANEGYCTGNASGLYWIDYDRDGDTSNARRLFCDMESHGGGWTLWSVMGTSRKSASCETGASGSYDVTDPKKVTSWGWKLSDSDLNRLMEGTTSGDKEGLIWWHWEGESSPLGAPSRFFKYTDHTFGSTSDFGGALHVVSNNVDGPWCTSEQHTGHKGMQTWACGGLIQWCYKGDNTTPEGQYPDGLGGTLMYVRGRAHPPT